jgi:hypothetical protein
MAQLLRHPEKMKKAAAELAEQLGSKDFVTESDLNKLPYLHAVVKETLRLHPAVPIIPREVVEDGVSLGGFNVPKRDGRRRQLVGNRRKKIRWVPRPPRAPCGRHSLRWFLRGRELRSSAHPFGSWCAARGRR